MVVLSLAPYSLSVVTSEEKHDCLAHETYSPSTFINASPREITVAELLNKIPNAVSLQLDFDVLKSWRCLDCGLEMVARRVSMIREDEAVCPVCQSARTPEMVREIAAGDSLSNCLLNSLGVPPRSILQVRTQTGIRFVELKNQGSREE